MKQWSKLKKFTSGISFRMISSTIFLICLINFISGGIGYARFTESLTNEYNDSAFRTAETAATLVDGDKIDEYLATGGNTEEYQSLWNRMDILCQQQNVTLIYVIAVDQSDYGRFLSVFNTVNHSSGYSPWEVGYQRDTTNEEYRQVYQDIYENGLERGTVIRTYDLRGRAPHITSLIPINNDAGDVTAILCVERPMEELSTGRVEYLDSIVAATVILSFVAAVVIALFLKMQLINPLRKVIDESVRFAKENKRYEVNDFSEISNITEIRDLGQSVEQMEMETLHYMENLTAVTAERERIGTELALATQIQANMMPSTFPAYPDRTDFDIYAFMKPAKEVGGDFYDFFMIDDDHLGIVMADVSGKGVPAALVMMSSKLFIKLYAEMGFSPAEVLVRANERLCDTNRNDMFVTAWFGILTLSTGAVVAANAGHEYPVIRKNGGKFMQYKDPHGFVLGGMEGMHYKEYSFILEKGDTLFLYTDGVPEATDVKDTLFGAERMLDALNQNADASPQVLLETVEAQVNTFVGDAPQFDDLTMLSVKIM